jgi:hypothetical protein
VGFVSVAGSSSVTLSSKDSVPAPGSLVSDILKEIWTFSRAEGGTPLCQHAREPTGAAVGYRWKSRHEGFILTHAEYVAHVEDKRTYEHVRGARSCGLREETYVSLVQLGQIGSVGSGVVWNVM